MIHFHFLRTIPNVIAYGSLSKIGNISRFFFPCKGKSRIILWYYAFREEVGLKSRADPQL
ncbi:hypothetical protein LEP1GSC058_3525 [Leptospira fainei serovar Hurstbridge str. BUT 6]|uniref:Uncharacterized protein n=1 Tax=Leptospira fainei serovar Hurstbridge str. BUT 6 TaxID=1193011 RepID=S3VXQ9_9LEPT|nr:hypothetical protein LEP1GSC058_3525 [Leptospira fainei serovar Hurstbridge str. BUT 6]